MLAEEDFITINTNNFIIWLHIRCSERSHAFYEEIIPSYSKVTYHAGIESRSIDWSERYHFERVLLVVRRKEYQLLDVTGSDF